jgi:hypothetical protein
LELFKIDVRKKAFTGGLRVLGIDLDPKPSDPGRLFTEDVSVILVDVSGLGDPFAGFVPAGTHDDGFDRHKRRRPGILGQPLGGRAVPDIDNDVRVGEGQEKLGSLVIGSGFPEIPALGNPGHLPLPGEKRIFVRGHVDRLLNGKGCVVAAQAQGVERAVPNDRNIRFP